MYVNKLESFLGKPAAEFKKTDIIKYVIDNDIKKLNFRYVGGDGRIKTLNFVISSKEQLNMILSMGERVDGSSLFSYIEAGSSDLYVVPKFRTAFLNPFNETPTLEIMCNYYTTDGSKLVSSPYNIMHKAHDTLFEKTGYQLHVMGELEFYIIADEESIYPATDQKGYHESPPFAKYGFLVEEAVEIITELGGDIKYAHSEVGNFQQDGKIMEQYEIEFQPTPMEFAAHHLILAKWVLRMLGYQYGVTISFAPKITVGKAGSGLHIHTKLVDKDGKNMMIENGKLSDLAKKVIAGYLDLSPSLTAFGNTIPTSYLRLVPHQEAPTNICWGDRNRSVLVRVPLGWLGDANKMVKDLNPLEDDDFPEITDKQTVEFRCPDGSANIYLLLAGLAIAARHGLEMDNALQKAEEQYVGVNIFREEHKDVLERLSKLPISCFESGNKLLEQIDAYTKYDVFTEGKIKDIAQNLKNFNDERLSEQLYNKHDAIRELVDKYLHFS